MIKVSAFRWVPPFARGLVRDLRVRWALEEAGLPVRSLPGIVSEDAVPWLEMGAQPLDVREPDELERGTVAQLQSPVHCGPQVVDAIHERAVEIKDHGRLQGHFL